jgi:putative ABC transport system permease protein
MSRMNEIRHAIRALRRSPTFALTAIVTLTLTLAINIGIFSTLNALAFRRLPAPRPHELVRLSTNFRTGQEVPLSFPMFRELARRQTTIAPLIGWTDSARYVEAGRQLIAARVTAATGNYFSEFGAIPTAGRLLLPDDINLDTVSGAPIAVLGYGFWLRYFGGSASAIGQRVLIDGVPFTVVGVGPRGFKGFSLMSESDITVPLTTADSDAPQRFRQAGLLWLNVAGRLKSGVALDPARAHVEAIWPAIKADIIPATHAGAQRDNFLSLPLRVESLATGYEPYLQGFRRPLVALQALAFLALIIGCLNLASLTFRRVAAGTSERAIRLALGATPWQAVQPVVYEAGLTSLIAAMCALPIGQWASAVISRMILPISSIPLTLNTGADSRVFAVAAALIVTAMVLFGVLPAWRSTRHDPYPALQQQARVATASSRLLRVVVVAQLALSVVLLTNASLLLRSLQRLLAVDLPVDSSRVAFAFFTPRPGSGPRPSDETYFPALLERITSLPDVEAAGIAQFPPARLGFRQMVAPMAWEPADGISAMFNSVTPGFFETLGIRTVVGRDFSWADHTRSPRVTILTRTLAERMFPHGDALGQRVRIGTQPYRQNLEVIGIVADARLYDLKDESAHAVYIADLQNPEPNPNGWLIVRGRVDEPTLQTAVQAVGPDFIPYMDDLSDGFAAAVTLDRVTALLAGIFGIATLVLAAVGVGGLFAYMVVLRTKEIAIRLALGGTAKTIVASIAREGLLIAVVGTAVGTAAATASTRLVRPLLFGVGPGDPWVVLGVPVALAIVALCACLIPALRASQVDPTVGLRTE